MNQWPTAQKLGLVVYCVVKNGSAQDIKTLPIPDFFWPIIPFFLHFSANIPLEILGIYLITNQIAVLEVFEGHFCGRFSSVHRYTQGLGRNVVHDVYCVVNRSGQDRQAISIHSPTVLFWPWIWPKISITDSRYTHLNNVSVLGNLTNLFLQ